MNRTPFKLSTHVLKNITFSTCSTVHNKSNASRQGKIFGKLFGKRVSGSKKRWVENPLPSSQFQQTSPFQFTTKKVDQSSKRRATVLNKLFMYHITDLLATGEASIKILGKGLQITRVKVTPNFQVCNVYWMAKGDAAEAELEQELQKCGGHLRHELSQLRLMGVVPRIHFVKDKTYANLALVESILKDCDFGDDHHEIDPSYQVKSDLYQEPPPLQNEDDEEEPLPPMRHDVFGLDHRAIMLRILAKMKKSEEAWEKHNSISQSQSLSSENESKDLLEEVEEQIKESEKDESEKDESFKKFLANMAINERMRKRRFRRADDGFYRRIGDDEDDPLEDGDYIDDDFDEKK